MMIYTWMLNCKLHLLLNFNYFDRDTSKVNLDIGLGLIVELTALEAKAFIPKKIELLKDRVAKLEDEIISIEQLKNQFLT